MYGTYRLSDGVRWNLRSGWFSIELRMTTIDTLVVNLEVGLDSSPGGGVGMSNGEIGWKLGVMMTK